ADLQAQAVRHVRVERDQGRAAIGDRPPFAFDDVRVPGRRRRIGDAAVAAQHPAIAARDLHVARRHALERYDPSTDHRRAAIVLRRPEAGYDAIERGALVGLDVDEEEARRAL